MKLEKLLNEYGESHQHPTNIFIHKICVPAITFSVIGLVMSLGWEIFGLDLAYWVGLAVGGYWFSLSWKYFLLMLPALGIAYLTCHYLELFGVLFDVAFLSFVISWIFQFYGHKIEGKKPSFLKDLQFLLIGPLWTLKTILQLKD